MRLDRGFVAVCVLLAANTASFGAEPARLAAPAFVLQNDAGAEFSLASFAGRPLVMNVFASWCPPCRQELPAIVAAARAHGGRVAFLGIDEQEPMQMGLAFAREMKFPYPIVFDRGQFAASYGATSLPETVFVDARGRIAAMVHGPITASELAADLAKISLTAKPART